MGRMYFVTFGANTGGAARDLFEIQAPSDAAVRVHSVDVSETSGETSEQTEIQLLRGEGSVTGGSGGSSATPVPASKGDNAFGGTVEVNNSTVMVAGSGAIKTLGRYGCNLVGGGFSWVPTPECRGDISPSDYFVVRLPNALSGARDLVGTVCFEEIGG